MKAEQQVKERFAEFEDADLVKVQYVQVNDGELYTVTIQRGDKLNAADDKGSPMVRRLFEEKKAVDPDGTQMLPMGDDKENEE